MANRKVLVRGLPLSASEDDITLFFESPRHCPDGGDVVRMERKENGTAVITFDDARGKQSVRLPYEYTKIIKITL